MSVKQGMISHGRYLKRTPRGRKRGRSLPWRGGRAWFVPRVWIKSVPPLETKLLDARAHGGGHEWMQFEYSWNAKTLGQARVNRIKLPFAGGRTGVARDVSQQAR